MTDVYPLLQQGAYTTMYSTNLQTPGIQITTNPIEWVLINAISQFLFEDV